MLLKNIFIIDDNSFKYTIEKYTDKEYFRKVA